VCDEPDIRRKNSPTSYTMRRRLLLLLAAGTARLDDDATRGMEEREGGADELSPSNSASLRLWATSLNRRRKCGGLPGEVQQISLKACRQNKDRRNVGDGLLRYSGSGAGMGAGGGGSWVGVTDM